MHQVTLHSTITHQRTAKNEQATYSNIATRDDTVVLPPGGGYADFSFPISAAAKSPVSTACLLSRRGAYENGRMYHYRAVSVNLRNSHVISMFHTANRTLGALHFYGGIL